MFHVNKTFPPGHNHPLPAVKRELKQTTTATAARTSKNKRFNEPNNGFASAFWWLLRRPWEAQLLLVFVYHLHRKTSWSTVANGTRRIPNGNFQRDAQPFPRKQDQRGSKPKGQKLVKLANETHIFHSEIPFGKFCLPFKKSCFPEKISVGGDKINLSISILSEISRFFE